MLGRGEGRREDRLVGEERKRRGDGEARLGVDGNRSEAWGEQLGRVIRISW